METQMWIQTFTPTQVLEIHQRFHRHSALDVDMEALKFICEQVNHNSRCFESNLLPADAIQVAAEYASQLQRQRWLECGNQQAETALIVAITYLRLSGYIVDCHNPRVFHLMKRCKVNRQRFEMVLYWSFTRQELPLSIDYAGSFNRPRLPYTHMGIDNYQGTARLRACVDEVFNLCCFNQDASVWSNHYAEVEAEQRRLAKILPAQVKYGVA
jgi:prophage maintenance system killer protein